MRANLSKTPGKPLIRGFTLAEVVICLAIVTTLFGGIIVAYTNANRRAKWSGYQLAAQALGIQQIEQIRSARWDLYDGIYEVTNLPLLNKTYTQVSGASGGTMTGYTTNVLNIPITSGNYIYATNFVVDYQTNSLWAGVTTNPPVSLRIIRVDTVWSFTWGNSNRLYTNTIVTYCAPDN